ncbi:hypothetical protein OE88DRAFT_1190754 [Heliocybe sulcata]|uniref:CAP-Gly domain-containing protein n=1 Tax=Heliocybe sulcata TaxID=5364 RepID=A0A5C3NBJ7_9AGAM|nr:hypothetical protein OE88DRAFT_1190754 [Heliocybe sulcata]
MIQPILDQAAPATSLYPQCLRSLSSSVTSPKEDPSVADRRRQPPPRLHRQADTLAQPKNAPRASKSYSIGDNVRIESLGCEGTLRYVGEIDGKPGTWAGVELSGGFAGKGKNDGSVNGTPVNDLVMGDAGYISMPSLSAFQSGSSVVGLL